MGWKELPVWVKGGLILAIVDIIALFIYYLLLPLVSPGNVVVNFILLFLRILFLLPLTHFSPTRGMTLTIFVQIVIYFGLGAVIGRIVGKVRGKR